MKNPESGHQNIYEDSPSFDFIVAEDVARFLRKNAVARMIENESNGAKTEGLVNRKQSEILGEVVKLMKIKSRELPECSADDLLVSLKKDLDRVLDEYARALKDDEDEILKEQAVIERAINMIGEIEIIIKSDTFKLWKEEKEPKATPRQSPNQKEDDAHRTKTLKEKMEQEALLEDINNQGGAYVSVSLPTGYHNGNGGGFEQIYDRNFVSDLDFHDIFKSESDGRDRDVLTERGVHELIIIKPLYIKREVNKQVEVTKGLVFKKTVTEQHVVVENFRAKHDEIVNGGKQEDAYKFVYTTCDDRVVSLYRDSASDRFGQNLLIQIVLPESVAKSLDIQLKKDPTLIRKIVEKTMLQKFGLEKSGWYEGFTYEGRKRAPVRPPYEGWAEKENGMTKINLRTESGEVDLSFESNK